MEKKSLQKDFVYFIKNCTKSPNSSSHYDGGLKTFVNERLSALIDGFQDIYDYDKPSDVQSFINVLQKDNDFTQRDNSSKGNKMYSNALASYLLFLKARDYFKNDSNSTSFASIKNDSPLQQIYFGAPGTGKSHIINSLTKGKRVIRTTFHPDSDYSTFVGAYKPTKVNAPVFNSVGQPSGIFKNEITYEFIPQAFLQAYVEAWKNMESPVYLIVEEINRGNCAQIFGDIFQLLDRNDNGFSDYPIRADKDIEAYLKAAFAEAEINDYPTVKMGSELLLPNNLYIWATMNTSDQSLFPIDSAFKRRWDWKYMPINDAGKGWRIVAAGNEYDWWQFLCKVNAYIGSITNSEDKKLGYFFCKPQNGQISAETFISKVVFYLWNDVFKDYGFDGMLFQAADGSTLTFDKFYTTNSINEASVVRFLENLEVEKLEETEER